MAEPSQDRDARTARAQERGQNVAGLVALVSFVLADVCGLGAIVLPWFEPSAVFPSGSEAYDGGAKAHEVFAHSIHWWSFGPLVLFVFVPLAAVTATAVMMARGVLPGPRAALYRRCGRMTVGLAIAAALMLAAIWRWAPSHASFTDAVSGESDSWHDIGDQAISALSRNPRAGAWLFAASTALLLVCAIALLTARPSGAETQPQVGGGSILFGAVAAPALTPAQRAAAQRARLFDCGDHVEWRDGRRTRRWRLPDQSTADPALPVLAAVRRTRSASTVVPGARGRSVQLVFVDAKGRKLAPLNPLSSGLINEQVTELAFPENAFADLYVRGVEIRDE